MSNRQYQDLLSAVEAKKEAFQRAVLDYAAHGLRPWTWRAPGASPFNIVIAELLLKRTTAAAASKVYETFCDRFPNATALRGASLEELASRLSSVGLQQQRAKAMALLAEYLVECHGGIVPSDLRELLKVPGLGDYSARAVLSFGFGIPAAVVDANVGRLLHRVCLSVMSPKPTQSLLQQVADTLLPRESHRDFNFALLDLGSLICRYVSPRHNECPLADICDFYTVEREIGGWKSPASPLRSARVAKKVALAELARLAGVSKLTIINIEAGRTKPQAETIRRLASVLGVRPEELTEPDGQA